MTCIGAKGQSGVWQRIIGQMPPHRVYVEPFAGSATVWRLKRPAEQSILIELDTAAIARLDAAAGLDTAVIQTCGIEWLENEELYMRPQLSLETLVYCDPPYLLETRRSRRYYRHEMTREDHERLLRVLCRLKCRVLLSGYPSALYSSHLQGWRCCRYRTLTRGATVEECLWANFPEPTELHDWRFAGRNYRERLTLRRLAARYLARLAAMPARKRGYVLNALREVTPKLALADPE